MSLLQLALRRKVGKKSEGERVQQVIPTVVLLGLIRVSGGLQHCLPTRGGRCESWRDTRGFLVVHWR